MGVRRLYAYVCGGRDVVFDGLSTQEICSAVESYDENSEEREVMTYDVLPLRREKKLDYLLIVYPIL